MFLFISKSRIKVRYVETDQMGIVHHSNYYAYFEVGRGDFIQECGISYNDMENMGVVMPLVDSYCKYIEGAKYDENLIIETYIEKLSPVKVIFNYNVVRERDKKTISKGKTTLAFVNKSFKIINLKKLYPEIWDKMQKLL